LPAYFIGHVCYGKPHFYGKSFVLGWSGKGRWAAEMEKFARGRFDLLTASERSAVRHYISVGKDRGDEEAVEAWEQYWRDAP